MPSSDSNKLSQRAGADRFHVTRDQVRYALKVTEELFVRLLREEVTGQVETEHEVDEEIRELESYLRP